MRVSCTASSNSATGVGTVGVDIFVLGESCRHASVRRP
jgi:hypothetical protein